jgi:uncharacterized membrane protein (DUF2068 family)
LRENARRLETVTAAPGAQRRDRGVVLIIVYKAVKGALWFVLATVIAVLVHANLADHVAGMAEVLRLHARPWSLELAKLLLHASTRHALWTLVTALYADGTLTLVEGWALYHGRWWGPWLVVVATGALLPYEVFSLIRHPRAVRLVLLLVNATIVVYLARVASQHARGLTRPAPPDAGSAAGPRGTSAPE